MLEKKLAYIFMFFTPTNNFIATNGFRIASDATVDVCFVLAYKMNESKSLQANMQYITHEQ